MACVSQVFTWIDRDVMKSPEAGGGAARSQGFNGKARYPEMLTILCLFPYVATWHLTRVNQSDD